MNRLITILKANPFQTIVSAAKLNSTDWLPVILSGCISGLVTLIMSVSFASLIFSGKLAPYLHYGVNMAIATTIISGSFIALLSQCRGSIAMPDDDTAPVVALMAAMVAASIPVAASPTITVLTIVAAITLTALITGLFLFVLGYFRLGGIIQYLPYSVMGGYFAGAGWLLVLGALKVATGLHLDTLTSAAALLEPHHVIQWVAAFVVALAAYFYKHSNAIPIGLPAIFVGAVVLFYIISLLFGTSPQELMDQGWLLGPFPEVKPSVLNPIEIADYSLVEWSAILQNLGSVGTILLLSAISILLTVSGLGLLFREDLNVNRELRVAGFSNIVTGLSGGMLAFPSLSVSSLVASIGAPRTRWIGIVSVLFCGFILYEGIGLVAYIPQPVLAGLLMFLGLNFFREWLIDAWHKFSLLEYLVIVMILIVVASVGYLQGVFLGLISAIVLFVINYSQTEVVRYELSGDQQKSNVERKVSEQKILREKGSKVLILGLQGYLFFGTASTLYNRILNRVGARDQKQLKYLILDFSKVTGIDSSAALSFIKMSQLAARRAFYLMLTGLDEDLERKLRKGGFGESHTEFLLLLRDLDHGIEWCEEQLIRESEEEVDQSNDSFIAQLTPYLADPADMDLFMSYLSQQEIEEGFELTRQGDLSDELFFIESSAASVYIQTNDGARHRVRRSGSGTVFGEVGFYLRVPRTATVIADRAGIIYSLSREKLSEMEKQHPALASAFHQFMAKLVTERLFFTTQTLETVLK